MQSFRSALESYHTESTCEEYLNMSISLKVDSIASWSFYVCACIFRKTQAIRLKLCLFLIVVLSVVLVLLMTNSIENNSTYEFPEYVLLNETEDQLTVNITGTCECNNSTNQCINSTHTDMFCGIKHGRSGTVQY